VARVRDEMDHRAATDLTPLPLTSVPAELRDLVRAFNAMLARLDAGMRGVRRFTADASHQMRTPLSILRAHVAVLRQARPGSAEASSSIDDIDQASNRLSHLLVQLIALARAEHALEAVRAGIDLHFDRAADPAMARTDPALATELVSNLVDNAIRYNRPGGTVSVLVDRAGATIAIEDDGPGIAPRDRERVFMRFMRLKRDARTEGSGLGLPIARSLAEAIGARLTLATPRSGRGLRVEVAFVAEA
jgi:two-component system sensor histidine kinase TctE